MISTPSLRAFGLYSNTIPGQLPSLCVPDAKLVAPGPPQRLVSASPVSTAHGMAVAAAGVLRPAGASTLTGPAVATACWAKSTCSSSCCAAYKTHVLNIKILLFLADEWHYLCTCGPLRLAPTCPELAMLDTLATARSWQTGT